MRRMKREEGWGQGEGEKKKDEEGLEEEEQEEKRMGKWRRKKGWDYFY